MVARNLVNTVTDKHSTRLRAHLDGPRNDAGARKVIEYSDGTEVHVERTGAGTTFSDGRPAMREVRTITRTKTPPTTFGQTNWTDPEQHDRIFRRQ